jgi:hypothetical protein
MRETNKTKENSLGLADISTTQTTTKSFTIRKIETVKKK